MRLRAGNRGSVICTAALLLASAAIAGTQGDAARAPVAHALALCCEADRLAGAEKELVLRRGLELAQEAAAIDPADARAHFAVFCNLGKQVQSRVLGPRDFGLIGRLRHEIDTALELAPDDPDALAAKGAMLLALPWFLGGDRGHGEELLRAALLADPANPAARAHLVEALRARGAGDEARALESADTEAPPKAVCAASGSHRP